MSKFVWEEGDVEHHHVSGEIKWMKVGNIPYEFRRHGVKEMHVAINMDSFEVFAGIHRLDIGHYALTYMPTGGKSTIAAGEQFDSFEDAMKAANTLLSEDGIEPHTIDSNRVSNLMLENINA